MEIHNLLKSQSNDVLHEITEAGFDPAEFEWGDCWSPRYAPKNGIFVSRLIHQSQYYFVFDNHDRSFYAQWSPASETIKSGPPIDLQSWSNQLRQFGLWLGYLKREVNSPNLWETVDAERNLLLSGSTDADNSPFSESEKEYLKAGVEEIREYLVSAHGFSNDVVEPQLRYLVESADRLGKKDFKNMLLGLLMGLVVNAAAPPETVQSIFQFVGTTLKGLFHSSLLLQ